MHVIEYLFQEAAALISVKSEESSGSFFSPSERTAINRNGQNIVTHLLTDIFQAHNNRHKTYSITGHIVSVEGYDLLCILVGVDWTHSNGDIVENLNPLS